MTTENAKTVEETRARFPELFNEGRFQELGPWYYTEDAVALPADHEPIVGRAAIIEYLTGLREELGVRFELGVYGTDAGADRAHLVGTYVVTTGDGGRAEGYTSEAWVLQADGTWKCTVDMWHDGS